MREQLLQFVGAALDLVYPRGCHLCGAPDPDFSPHLCWNCAAELAVVREPFCRICGDPVSGRVDHAYACYSCAAARPGFDVARSAVLYEGGARQLVQDFKYHQALWLETDLWNLLAACLLRYPELGPFDAVMAVPLHPARRRARGYNQAGLLAQRLARRTRRAFLRGALSRVKPTATQTHLTAQRRASNVCGAFRMLCARRVRGRRILLVDDVMTTGATVSECARVLKRTGAEFVAVVTVARGAWQ